MAVSGVLAYVENQRQLKGSCNESQKKLGLQGLRMMHTTYERRPGSMQARILLHSEMDSSVSLHLECILARHLTRDYPKPPTFECQKSRSSSRGSLLAILEPEYHDPQQAKRIIALWSSVPGRHVRVGGTVIPAARISGRPSGVVSSKVW